ncbi:hypothetical protein LTR17_015490 [Elasticomyces elasticus]|nr:hypothetical protein LTR17_015490 [Elasticomyces elasticus]
MRQYAKAVNNPETTEQFLEQWAVRLTEGLLASRRLAKGYRVNSSPYELGGRIAIAGKTERDIQAGLQRVDALVHTVFRTYELLEMILLRLPMRDLLLATQVNKTFQGIIERSDPIQRALYMKPDIADLPSGGNFEFNDLLWGSSSPHDGPWYGGGAETHYPSTLVLDYWHEQHYFERAPPLEICDGFGSAGSWQKMYLTRPTAKMVEISLWPIGDGATHAGDVFINYHQATMGVIQDTLRKMYSQTVASDQWREFMDDTATCGCDSCEEVEAAKRAAQGSETSP